MNTVVATAVISTVGRPILQEEELELKVYEDVELYKKQSNDKHDRLLHSQQLIVTNFRIIFLVLEAGNRTKGWEIHFRTVECVSKVEKLLIASKRMNLFLHVPPQKHHLQLKFMQGGRDEFCDLVERALTRRSWEAVSLSRSALPSSPHSSSGSSHKTDSHKTADAASPPAAPASLSSIGVGGILHRQTTALQHADALATAALHDLDSLSQKAREVVSVVQRYAHYLAERRGGVDGEEDVSETTTQIMEANELEQMMQNIGVISPVTRLSAGNSLYTFSFFYSISLLF